MAYFNLYRADTGAFLAKIDIGDGLRGKTWLDEFPQILLEAATDRGLSLDGYGVLANFPALLDGRKTQSRPIGEALSAKRASSFQLFKAVPQTQRMGTGDAASTQFGDDGLTQPVPAVAAYGSTPTSTSNAVMEPAGAQTPAYLISDTGAANYNLAATNGILSLLVNGVRFNITVGVGAATTRAAVEAAIQASGAPVKWFTHNTNFIMLQTLGLGATQSIMVDSVVGTAGAVIFGANDNTLCLGNGSPLGQMDNSDAVAGWKPQRRILPGSLSITCTMAAEVVTSTDDAAGVITGSNVAGTATVAGTITYATGAIEFDTVGDAPDNATAVTAQFKALIPVDLHDEVTMPVGGGIDLAVLVS